MTDIILTSEITVRLIQMMGGDHMLVAAAKASTTGEAAVQYAAPESSAHSQGLIDFLVRHRHGTPAEHSAMTFFVHAPAFVWWEWIRHRVGQAISVPGLGSDCPDASFNLESGRYKKLDPVFWVPRPDRAMIPAEGFRPARPAFEPANPNVYTVSLMVMRHAYHKAWEAYESLIQEGVANEVARAVLPFAVYYSGWVTCNPRSLMSFISLRTHDPDATYVSYPQAEIEEAARAAEAVLAEHWPTTYAKFVKNGRVGP